MISLWASAIAARIRVGLSDGSGVAASESAQAQWPLLIWSVCQSPTYVQAGAGQPVHATPGGWARTSRQAMEMLNHDGPASDAGGSAEEPKSSSDAAEVVELFVLLSLLGQIFLLNFRLFASTFFCVEEPVEKNPKQHKTGRRRRCWSPDVLHGRNNGGGYDVIGIVGVGVGAIGGVFAGGVVGVAVTDEPGRQGEFERDRAKHDAIYAALPDTPRAAHGFALRLLGQAGAAAPPSHGRKGLRRA